MEKIAEYPLTVLHHKTPASGVETWRFLVRARQQRTCNKRQYTKRKRGDGDIRVCAPFLYLVLYAVLLLYVWIHPSPCMIFLYIFWKYERGVSPVSEASRVVRYKYMSNKRRVIYKLIPLAIPTSAYFRFWQRRYRKESRPPCERSKWGVLFQPKFFVISVIP